MTQKNYVFECAPVGGYGSDNRFEKRITVLVTYRQSQEMCMNAARIILFMHIRASFMHIRVTP